MGRVTLIDHTADVGLLVEGSDLNDLFRSAANGLFGYVIANPESIAHQEELTVSVAADSLAELLVAWLNELVFAIETSHRIFRAVSVRVDQAGLRVSGVLAGERLDPDRHLLDHEVKAVTHHGARVEPRAGGWVAEVILDI